jgi:hypothetical protein
VLLELPFPTPHGRTRVRLSTSDSGLVLDFAHQAAFWVSKSRVTYQASRGVGTDLLQVLLFGTIFSIWLELHEILVVHASSVVVGGRAVFFMGDCGHGKSMLAAEFLRYGRHVLGDDLGVVSQEGPTWGALPALPWINAGPDVARLVGRDFGTLETIHHNVRKRRLLLGQVNTGDGPTSATPLGPIFVLNRRADVASVSITRLKPSQALRALVRHSAAPRSMDVLGLQASRLPRLGALADAVGVYQLTYPTGLDHLADVRRAVDASVA